LSALPNPATMAIMTRQLTVSLTLFTCFFMHVAQTASHGNSNDELRAMMGKMAKRNASEEECTFTDWIDLDNPSSGDGDFEDSTCERGFSKVEIRAVGGTQIFYSVAEVLAATGDIVTVNETGVSCVNAEQADGCCQDYEAKFCCNDLLDCSIDLVFILDRSGSISPENWKLVLDFVKSIFNVLHVSPTAANVGMVVFSTNAENKFYLNTHATNTDLIKAIKALPKDRGITNTAEALQFTRDDQFTALNGDRPDAKNMVVLITDGMSNRQRENTVPNAQLLHADGVTVIPIGVRGSWLAEIVAMASNPVEGTGYFMRPTFDLGIEVHDEIIRQACELSSD